MHTVSSIEEIKKLVRTQEDQFLIKGDFSEFITEIRNQKLTDDEKVWFQLGIGGGGDVVTWYLTRLWNRLSTSDAGKRDLLDLQQEITRLYKITVLDETLVKLELEQLSY